MPDIGLIELALIGLIAFLVLGPERLPEFFAQIGQIVRQGKTWLHGVKRQLDYEKQQMTKPIEEVKSEVHASVSEVEKSIQTEKGRD